MRKTIAKIYVWLFLGVIVFNGVSAYVMTRTKSLVFVGVFVGISIGIPVLLTFLAGLIWDAPEVPKSVRRSCWMWVVLPLAMLAVVLYGLIKTPPDNPGAWQALGAVIVWNLLLPLGRLIARRIWHTSTSNSLLDDSE